MANKIHFQFNFVSILMNSSDQELFKYSRKAI